MNPLPLKASYLWTSKRCDEGLERIPPAMATLLCLPGVWPEMSKLPKFDFVIGVDSGADAATSHGIIPDLVVGDLDSVIKENYPHQDLIIISEQDDNDLSKALRFCLEKNLKEISIVGFTGKRNDHELANYAALHNANENLDIKVILEDMIVQRVVSSNDVCFVAPIGTLISIFSFEETKVKTTGLKWNLDEKIRFSSRGLSNRTVESMISISTTGCVFVLIHNS